jgi:acetate kinase
MAPRSVASRPDLRLLVVNAGSSSLKLRLLGPSDELIAQEDLDAPRAEVDAEGLGAALDGMEVDVVVHRIVHGGARFREAVRLDGTVANALRDLVDLAPLHQPKSLATIDAVSAALPELPAVACFDTAFHATLPEPAHTYALPPEWRERWALRRYGFHGLSHAYAARRAAAILGREDLRLVTCHLGAGASLCAVEGGRSVDTTMGFTPLEGLVMGTRSGSVDPGMLLWLLEHERLREAELADALEHRAGLLALGGSGDMRNLLARDDDDARLAVETYLHRLRAGIASMTAALGGIDAIVFTGGVGENSAEVRVRAAARLGYLGIDVDGPRNDAASGDCDVSGDGASVHTLVVAAREDLEMARQARQLLEASA